MLPKCPHCEGQYGAKIGCPTTGTATLVYNPDGVFDDWFAASQVVEMLEKVVVLCFACNKIRRDLFYDKGTDSIKVLDKQ